jgi:hypothetical protein
VTATTVDGIILKDGNERVDLWHPALRERVAALSADPRMRGTLWVESAVRTYTEQKYLYDNQHLPGFNLAANPDQWLTPAYGLSAARGSWHMQQPDGYGYAVDFYTSVLPGDVYRSLPLVAAEYRLIQTVLHAGLRPHGSHPPPDPATPTDPRLVKEWWHFQAPYNEGPLQWVPPAKDDDMTEEQEAKLDRLLEILEPGSPLRRQLNDVEAATELLRSDTYGLARVKSRLDGVGRHFQRLYKGLGVDPKLKID